jgi:TP901 family phage tail tape measure protein
MAIGRGGIRIPIISEFDEKGIKKFANSTQALGKSLTMRLTLPIVGLGAAAVKMSMEFETSMAKITGLVGVAADQTKIMGDQAITMASKYGKSATEAAEALFFITSAGLRGKEAMDVLESSLKASAIGLGETATIADVLTSAVNAYGSDVLSASKATDILVAAVREGKLEASELAGSIGSVLPVSSALGVGLADVAAAMAALSRTGTNAATAATQLRGILNSILKPSSQANKELEKFGLSAAGLRRQLREEGLLATLVTLKNTFGDNEEAVGKVFGNVRALSGVLDLTGANLESTEQIFQALNNTLDDTDKAFAVIAESSGFKFNVATATMKNSLISFGDIIAPVLIKAAEFLKTVAERFSNLTDQQKKTVVIVLAVIAAIGPLILLIGTLAKAVMLLASVFALLSKTFVLIPLIIFSLIGAFKAQSDAQYILAKETGDTWGMIRRFIVSGLKGVSESIESFINMTIFAFGTWFGFVSYYLNPLNFLRFDPNGKHFDAHMKKMQGSLKQVDFSGFRDKVEKFDGVLVGLGETVSSINAELKDSTAVADAAQAEIDKLKEEFKDLGEEKEKTEKKAKKLKEALQKLREGMVQIKTKAVEALKESLNEAQRKLDEARDKFNAFKNSITGAITGIINFGKAAESDSFLTGLTEQANAATSFADKVKKLVQMGLSERAISEVLKAGFEAGSKIADEIINGGSTVVNQVNTLLASVESVADQVGQYGAEQFYQAGVQQGEALVNGILEALRQAQAELAAAVKAAAQGGDIRTFGARATNLLDAIGTISGSKKQANAIAAFEQALAGSGKISKKEDAAIRAKFKLAKGGIVMGPTNALIGEAGPEAVIPLSGANSARGALGSTINITVNAGIGTDGSFVGRQIVDAIRKYERTSGPVFAKA